MCQLRGGTEGLRWTGKKNRLTLCFLATGFEVEIQLDWQKQKGGVRRALFLASKQATLTQTLLIQNGAREDCREMKIYLRVRPEDGGGLAWVTWPHKTKDFGDGGSGGNNGGGCVRVRACGWMADWEIPPEEPGG